LSGPPRISKSNIATNLAERLNISNVLQTEIVKIMMNSVNNKKFSLNKIAFEDENLSED
jgi:2-phosphoglycerate kinase